MRIAIASDHGGFKLKGDIIALLRERGGGIVVDDLGPLTEATTDYPDAAHAVAHSLTLGKADRGILVCGTGIGMSIAANRHRGVRAVVCSDTYSARLSRSHNDTNVLCLGERVLGKGLAWEIVAAWLDEPVSADERHTRRRAKIELGT